MKRCGEPHPEHDTPCVLGETPAHLDHLDAADRTWINSSIVQTHDFREYGSPLTLARNIACHTRRATTARFNTDGLPNRSR